MTSENNQNRASWPVAFGRAPFHGSRAMGIALDFTLESPVNLNLVYDQQSEKLEFVQSIYVDNSSNPYPLIGTMRTTGQIFSIPAGYQGYIPVLASADNAKMSFATTLTPIIPIQLLTFPLPAILWPAGAGSSGGDFSANKPVLLANLITTIPVNPSRAFADVQNQSAGQIQVVLDDGVGGNISIFLLGAGSGSNTQGGEWTSTTFKGRVRVYAGTSTDQIMARQD